MALLDCSRGLRGFQYLGNAWRGGGKGPVWRATSVQRVEQNVVCDDLLSCHHTSIVSAGLYD
jgi:hypothetical protein